MGKAFESYYTPIDLLEEFNRWKMNNDIKDLREKDFDAVLWDKWKDYRDKEFKSRIYLAGFTIFPEKISNNLNILI